MTDSEHRDQRNASKPCIVADCTGTMQFHDRREVAHGPHTLEWPWHATWVCTHDSTHVHVISHAEYREIIARR